MFYSHVILSKKGPLGTIWVAAHCLKRLNKCQVSQTDISSSIDKILLDEVPVVTYRILGHLLVGIVRIYSKKVEYLFNDCNTVLAKLGDFANGKSRKPQFEATHSSYFSISLPRRFELDAFELEIPGVQDGHNAHVRAREDIMLSDVWRRDNLVLGLSNKVCVQEDSSHSQAYSKDHTPRRDVCSPHLLVKDINCCSTSYETNFEPMEKHCVTRFALDECSDPMTSEGIGNQIPNDQESDGEELAQPDFGSCNLTEMEMICTFSLEDRLEPLIIDDEEAEADPTNEQMRHRETKMFVNEEELHGKSWDEEQPVDVEQMKIPEMPSSSSGTYQISENHPVSISENNPVSITVDVTPNSKFPGDSGAPSPDLMFVRTPATKERPRTSKKRKCLLDDPVVISNHEFKKWINNHKDLVCKRRKVPHIPLDVWKIQKFSSLPGSLLEPLIPCSALVDTSILVCKTRIEPESVDCMGVPQNNDMPETPSKQRSREQTPIAPSTPVTFSNSWRLHNAQRSAELDILEPASSTKSTDKNSQQKDDQELDINSMDEEINSSDGDIQEKYKCSVRTRSVATYLLKTFLAHKGEPVNLSSAVKGKTKKESARMFYETLVLKSGCWIDVRQDNAYGDICVLETPKLKQTFAAEVTNLGN